MDGKKSILKGILAVLAFIVCVGLVIQGGKTVSLASLGMQLAGLAGILVLLYLYNRGFTKDEIPDYQEEKHDDA